MAKLVPFETPDRKTVYVNSETVRAVLPSDGNAFVVLGSSMAEGILLKGAPRTIADKLIG
ncbi:hypothetical protein [Sphingobium sp.]|uniref:hypothetical protein n=1 Tax=Sphingobium sp. TaxID=1912891 RepID=UPI0028BF50DD|nr:hypothetical protein [Sphingobium sp.]